MTAEHGVSLSAIMDRLSREPRGRVRRCDLCDGTDGYHGTGCPSGRLLDLPCPECGGRRKHDGWCERMTRAARATAIPGAMSTPLREDFREINRDIDGAVAQADAFLGQLGMFDGPPEAA